MSDKPNAMFQAAVDVGGKLHENTVQAFKAKSVQAGMVNIQPHEWKARVNSDPAFAEAEMKRLQSQMGRRQGRSEFLRLWR